jgi:hypothetical protein
MPKIIAHKVSNAQNKDQIKQEHLEQEHTKQGVPKTKAHKVKNT